MSDNHTPVPADDSGHVPEHRADTDSVVADPGLAPHQ